MVQYAGDHSASERLVRRGDPSDPRWAVAWLTGDRLDAILTVGRPRDLVQARRVIAAGTPVDPEAIADPDVPVRQAVRAERSAGT
jgi:3-phenylpropionate/trans-cinnamate dioxygenase ferredoxin reductase subunit